MFSLWYSQHISIEFHHCHSGLSSFPALTAIEDGRHRSPKRLFVSNIISNFYFLISIFSIPLHLYHIFYYLLLNCSDTWIKGFILTSPMYKTHLGQSLLLTRHWIFLQLRFILSLFHQLLCSFSICHQHLYSVHCFSYVYD